jgi:hypothetical protein
MIIEFHLENTPMSRERERETQACGEPVVMRLGAILCLFPERRQIRTTEHAWTVTVCEEDRGKGEGGK